MKKNEEVRIFHLTTGGAPIIAKSTFYAEYTLDEPLYVVYYRDEDEVERVQFNNVTAFAKENQITIKEEHVIFSYLPAPAILNYYNDTLLSRLEPIQDDED